MLMAIEDRNRMSRSLWLLREAFLGSVKSGVTLR